jgi:GNAT superfamily N-acetyltransferase
MIFVRPARLDDLPAMSQVLIASITQLCTADHHNDPAVIASWTRNKSAAALKTIMEGGAAELFVATRDGHAVGVGAISGQGIGLNYVDPDHRGTGVSSTLLRHLEHELIARGVVDAKLESTRTAYQFYLERGWSDDEPTGQRHTVEAFPMRKRLAGEIPPSELR